MPWHIEPAVIRGHFDNRERGRVSGRLWLMGREEPLELELKGDPWGDLAGRVLEFENPNPQPLPFVPGLAKRQEGTIGDCTASRKVKVLSAAAVSDHWRNGLQLEWFGPDGRMMIESVTFHLAVSKESTWSMTTAAEAAQRRSNAVAREVFLRTLGEEPDDGLAAQEDGAAFDGRRGFWGGGGEDPLADFAAAIDAAEAALLAREDGAMAIEREKKAVERLERIRAYLGEVARMAEFCTMEGMFEARWGERVQARIEAHVARIDGVLRDLRGVER